MRIRENAKEVQPKVPSQSDFSNPMELFTVAVALEEFTKVEPKVGIYQNKDDVAHRQHQVTEEELEELDERIQEVKEEFVRNLLLQISSWESDHCPLVIDQDVVVTVVDHSGDIPLSNFNKYKSVFGQPGGEDE